MRGSYLASLFSCFAYWQQELWHQLPLRSQRQPLHYICFYTRRAGDAHVYTLGYIGEHRVVSTKLPQIGRTRGAQISAGNNTTRLLGQLSPPCCQFARAA